MANTDLAVGTVFALDKDAAKYLIHVLRRDVGDQLVVFNGDGNNYLSSIVAAGSKPQIKVETCTENLSESKLDLTLVQALAKGSKLDLVIQKATELGVRRIVPVVAERSIMQIDADRQQKKLNHWRGVAVSASAQCGRSVIPDIETPARLADWFQRAGTAGLLLHPTGHQSISSVTVKDQTCTLFVGPEGGFSDRELAAARDVGIQFATCGPRILRTETAGFTATAILQSRYGDL
jgi:16S rRNA (uracil1498-N3)-methyltransferase